jgi:CRP-like cAMP-binding protein
MEEVPYRTIELSAGRFLFKKGEFYDSFYLLISGSIELNIAQVYISIDEPIIIGDYEIVEDHDYRLSTVRTISNCWFRVFKVRAFSEMKLYHEEFNIAFDKFSFRSRILKYLIKKLFFLSCDKRGEKVGGIESIGVVLEGAYKIDRNIQIVKMKAKNLQLLRKF